MMHALHTTWGGIPTIYLTDSTSGSTIQLMPTLGGLVQDWRIPVAGKMTSILQGYTSAEDLLHEHRSSFRGAFLMPFPNRIADGKYRFGQNDYQLPIDFPQENNAIHGFFSTLPLMEANTTQGNDFVSILLKGSYDGSTPGYPFHFEASIAFLWQKKHGLTFDSSITNNGKTPMPFGYGWHPYFTTGSPIDSLQLTFQPKSKLAVNQQMIPTGEKIPYSHFRRGALLQRTKFDDCFEVSAPDLTLLDEKKGVKIGCWQEMGSQGLNYLQLYTPKGRSSIAVEPMSCIPNAFNSGEGLISILPGDSLNLKHGVTINY